MATCRTCAYLRKCIEKATKEGYEHNVDFDASDGCPNFGFKSNTNADRIRAWNDHELAETIANFVSEIDNGDVRYSDDPNDWLEWLKQPAEV